MTKFDLPPDPDAAHAVLLDRINQHEIAIDEIREANRKQDEKLEKIERNTSTLVEIFKAGRGTFKLAGWMGKLVVWFGSLAGAVYAIWYAIINWPHKGG